MNATAATIQVSVHRGRNLVLAVLSAWFAAGTLLGLSGVFLRVPRPIVAAIIAGTVACWVFIASRSPDIRAFLRQIDLRIPIAYQITRVGWGAALMHAAAQGQLPHSVTDKAGPGDIAVGVLALVALVLVQRKETWAKRGVSLWNLLGAADMLMVVALVQHEIFFGEGVSAFSAMGPLHYTWLPTIVVPLVLVCHLLVFLRTRPAAEA